MVTAAVAEATKYGVNVKDGSGQTVRVLDADLADRKSPHGINTDEAEELLERAGYLPSTWRWTGTYYKTVVHSRAEMDAYERRKYGRTLREIGAESERATRLEIARTGKRPSGKPLTPEMRQWVADYRRGVRDFGP